MLILATKPIVTSVLSDNVKVISKDLGPSALSTLLSDTFIYDLSPSVFSIKSDSLTGSQVPLFKSGSVLLPLVIPKITPKLPPKESDSETVNESLEVPAHKAVI